MKKRPEKRLQWFLTTVVKVLWICDHFRLGQQQQHHHTLSYKTSSNPKENRSFILIEETSNKFSPSNWKRKVSGSIPLHVVSCLAKKTLTHLPRLWTINWEEPGSILRHQYKYPFTKKASSEIERHKIIIIRLLENFFLVRSYNFAKEKIEENGWISWNSSRKFWLQRK